MYFIAWVSTCLCFHSKLWGIVRLCFLRLWCFTRRDRIEIEELAPLKICECVIWMPSWALLQPRVAGHPLALYQLWLLILFPCFFFCFFILQSTFEHLICVRTQIWVVLCIFIWKAFSYNFLSKLRAAFNRHQHTHRPVVFKELTLAFAFVKVRAPILWGRPRRLFFPFFNNLHNKIVLLELSRRCLAFRKLDWSVCVCTWLNMRCSE